MPANLENPAVATELEKVRFRSNPKERQCQRMLKLPHNCKLFEHSLALPFFGIGIKTVATDEFSKFADILSAAL